MKRVGLGRQALLAAVVAALALVDAGSSAEPALPTGAMEHP